MVRRTVIHNPFDRSHRTIEDLEIGDGMQPLARFIEERDGHQIITIVNGEVIPPGERALKLIRPNDFIVVAPVLQGGGGGGGKTALRMIAMIGILAASIFVPFALAGAGLIASGGLAAAAIGAGIAVGGSLLITALTPKPNTAAGQDTATYGWDGPQMTARQGLIINKGYGIFGEAGNVLDSYIYTAQDKQYMNLLISYGWGPARSITGIQINNNPIENYQGITIEKRLGFLDQTPVSFFNDVVNEFPQSTKVRVDSGAVIFNGHGTDTEAIEVEVNFPKGLWAGPNTDGSYDPWTVFYKVEYSLHGSGTFETALTPRTTADVDGTPVWLAIVQDQFSGGPNDIIVAATSNSDNQFEGEPGPDVSIVLPFSPSGVSQPTESRIFTTTWVRNPLNGGGGGIASPPGGTPKTVTNWSQISDSVTGNVTTIIRHVTRVNLPSAGQWDVRVTKLGSGQNTSTPTPHDNDSPRRGEEFWVTSIREFAHDALQYPNMVLLGIRALATDQLSGSGINITAVVDHGDPESLGYKHVIAADRPQVYYRLNEASGTVANDSSGRGNNATYSGTGVTLQQPSLIQQSANLAAAFDGASSTKITTPSLPLGTSYSIDMWIKPVAFGAAVFLASNAGTGDGLHLDASGKLNIQFSTLAHLSVTALTLNTVNHVALRVDQGFTQFIINGVIDGAGYSGATALTVDTLLAAFHGTADEICICSPVIRPPRMAVRYQFGTSDRNKMEDFTGNNQATVCWDMLTSRNYGGKIDPNTDIDIDAFVDWSNRCNELVDDGNGGQMFRHSFNGVFDTSDNMLDARNRVSNAGRANVILSGGRRYTVVQDKPADPVQLFTMGSIVQGTFQETWLALADRANSIDIQFSNAADSYNRDVVTVQDEDQVDADGEVRPAPTLDLFGATTEAECFNEGNYRLLSNQKLLRSIQFGADVEAIAIQLGDVFLFSHDVPQWGESGRIEASTDASHVTLDRQVTMDALKTYQLLCQLPSVKRFTGNITSISGPHVTIGSFTPTARVLRLVDTARGIDYAIEDFGSGFVVLEAVAGLVNGDSVDLYDLDVIETINVVNTGNTTAAIQTTAPFTVQPRQFDIYAFGEVNLAAKPFRCVKISRAKDQQFTIYGLEYDATIYTDETPVLSGGVNGIPTMDVNTLIADETYDLVGERYVDYLRLGWRPGTLTVGADIYVSINGGVEKYVDTVNSATSYMLPTVVGQVVLARIVGFDVKGNRANYLSAPTVTFTMQGVTTNMILNPSFQGSLAHWDVNWRTGDNVQRQVDSDGDGFVQYNIIGSTLAAAQKILSQLSINPSEWAVGDFIMSSMYVETTGGATGNLAMEMVFNGAGTTVRAEWNLATATNGKTRINTPANTQVPVGTTSIDVIVRVRDGGSGVSVAVGKVITVSHLMQEIVIDGTIATPSKWSDVDNGTNAATTLAGGDITSLVNAGSLTPVVSGLFAISVTDTQATVSWSGYKLSWGAGATGFVTNVQDGSYVITGLTGSVAYVEIPYYDIGTSGAIKNIEGLSNSHGSPAGAYTPSPKTDAVQAQILKGRVPLGFVSFTTNAPGVTSPVGGTGGGSPGRGPGGLGFPQS